MKHFFFTLVEKGQLEVHLQSITDFWHDLLFLSSTYGNNAVKPHLELHKVKKWKLFILPADFIILTNQLIYISAMKMPVWPKLEPNPLLRSCN